MVLIFADEPIRDGIYNERTQRVADHIIHFRHTKSVAVLRVLNSRAEDAADKCRKGDSAPVAPLLRQCIGQRQPQREKEKHVHQHLAVELRLLVCCGKCGERGEN